MYRKARYTLIELLVLIAIITMLITGVVVVIAICLGGCAAYKYVNEKQPPVAIEQTMGSVKESSEKTIEMPAKESSEQTREVPKQKTEEPEPQTE
jgi:hypothetical protein